MTGRMVSPVPPTPPQHGGHAGGHDHDDDDVRETLEHMPEPDPDENGDSQVPRP